MTRSAQSAITSRIDAPSIALSSHDRLSYRSNDTCSGSQRCFPASTCLPLILIGQKYASLHACLDSLFASPWLSLFVWTILSHGHEALLFAQTQPLHASKPNIVLIITDDQGYPPIGRLGHPWIQTPNLDELHDRSVRFDRFSSAPRARPLALRS